MAISAVLGEAGTRTRRISHGGHGGTEIHTGGECPGRESEVDRSVRTYTSRIFLRSSAHSAVGKPVLHRRGRRERGGACSLDLRGVRRRARRGARSLRENRTLPSSTRSSIRWTSAQVLGEADTRTRRFSHGGHEGTEIHTGGESRPRVGGRSLRENRHLASSSAFLCALRGRKAGPSPQRARRAQRGRRFLSIFDPMAIGGVLRELTRRAR